jgi:hypothetical protein
VNEERSEPSSRLMDELSRQAMWGPHEEQFTVRIRALDATSGIQEVVFEQSMRRRMQLPLRLFTEHEPTTLLSTALIPLAGIVPSSLLTPGSPEWYSSFRTAINQASESWHEPELTLNREQRRAKN